MLGNKPTVAVGPAYGNASSKLPFGFFWGEIQEVAAGQGRLSQGLFTVGSGLETSSCLKCFSHNFNSASHFIFTTTAVPWLVGFASLR